MQVQQLRTAGKEPYAYVFPRTHAAAELQARHVDLPAGEHAVLAEVRSC
jgi:lysyl-tRNA synthetase class 2